MGDRESTCTDAETEAVKKNPAIDCVIIYMFTTVASQQRTVLNGGALPELRGSSET